MPTPASVRGMQDELAALNDLSAVKGPLSPGKISRLVLLRQVYTEMDNRGTIVTEELLHALLELQGTNGSAAHLQACLFCMVLFFHHPHR